MPSCSLSWGSRSILRWEQYFPNTYAVDATSIDLLLLVMCSSVYLSGYRVAGSWAATAALQVLIECRYTIAMSAWYSAHQFPSCECIVKPLHTSQVHICCIHEYIWLYAAIYTCCLVYIHAILAYMEAKGYVL